MSGTLKASGAASAFPVDLTVAALALLLGAATVVIMRRAELPVSALWPYGVVVASVMWQALRIADSDYASEKFIEFMLLSIPAAIAVTVVVRTRLDLRSANGTWIVLALTAGLLAIGSLGALGTTSSSGLTSRLYVGDAGNAGAGPVGYSAGAVLLITIASLMAGRMRRAVGIPVIAVLSMLLLASASRAPLIGAGVAAVFLVLASARVKEFLPWAVAVGLISTAVLALVPAQLTARLSLEDAGRESLWRQAWAGFLEEPLFGHGFASFSNVSRLRYPHNLLLEVAYEGGLVALACMAAVIGVAVARVWRARHHHDALLAGTVLIYFLAMSMVALDIRNRLLWIALGICFALTTVFGSDKRSARKGVAAFSRSRSPSGRTLSARSTSQPRTGQWQMTALGDRRVDSTRGRRLST